VALTHAFSWPEVRRGAERLVAELSHALAQLGVEVTVFSSAFEPGTTRRDGVREVRLKRRQEDTGRAEAAFGRHVLPRLLAGRFDVVHSFGRRDGVASLRAARVHPRRVTVHTEIGIPWRSWWETMGEETAYFERVVRDVDVYACMSEYSLGVLESDYGRTGVLLPGGVDVERFRPAAAIRSAQPTILFSGALAEWRKGLAPLLEALPMIAKEEPDVRLLLSGPGDVAALLAAAPEEARARTDVLGTGSLEEQPARYASAWVCALPSSSETFGLVLLEALACGTPVVAADHAALPELVTPGVTGALCEFGDPPSIARACIDAIRLARDASTEQACRASALPYDWKTAIAPRCLALYEHHPPPTGVR
jgi:phosphatidylinositol alpha-mannosyltransferase